MLKDNLKKVLNRIEGAELRFQRPKGSVALLAVSKGQPIAKLIEAFDAGIRELGENYLQEALPKIQSLSHLAIAWHFIGKLQSNKIRRIAESFAWVHAIESLEQANSLNEHRKSSLPQLNVCIQLDVRSRSNSSLQELWPSLHTLALAIAELPRLQLRGLMCLPHPSPTFDQQRARFRMCREAMTSLQQLLPSLRTLDTLSMGMSQDLEAAVAEGATLVRIGTAIFGQRSPVK